MPSLSACWRRAPIVRFICLEIFTTGVFAFECAFSVRQSPLVHGTRLVTFFAVFATVTILCCLFEGPPITDKTLYCKLNHGNTVISALPRVIAGRSPSGNSFRHRRVSHLGPS